MTHCACPSAESTLRPGGRLVISAVHPVADWQQIGGSYFTDEMIDGTWNDGWNVRFRRAPLTAWCAEFREAGFLIERLVEPLPAESMKDRFPKTYGRFLCGDLLHRVRPREDLLP